MRSRLHLMGFTSNAESSAMIAWLDLDRSRLKTSPITKLGNEFLEEIHRLLYLGGVDKCNSPAPSSSAKKTGGSLAVQAA